MNETDPTDFFYLREATVYRGAEPALHQMNLTLRTGQHTAILGPNGAGKSTLLKVLTRELRPRVTPEMRCEIFGKTLFNLWDLRKKIGVVSQDLQNDYRSLATGFEVVLSAYFGSVGLHSHHTVSVEQKQHAERIMAQMDIGNLAALPYLQLSTGQQRRLLLARALIHQPEVLVFDEPTSGLDMKSALLLVAHMRALAKTGVTLVLVTHHLNEIIPEISRVVLLNEGRVYADGSTAEVLTSDTLSDLYQMPLDIFQTNGFYQATPRNVV
ncbi:hemin import ATP-binding protein HmuV [Teredinibacter turnerae T7901]|uniref:Hemin import ATP-binding protein HmuV n=1 Tax=Teredinibacter turnerae (strain ATCC 39867 / T7901) TaxID=377629 RepID=C5BLV2_TERTT|nr:ATP-binding cassette domain-containing protein [Teredinibacter turnerae]ACR12865.1 hemin import ATP-binding protein HmuV [Teredinibacter turnerae T7901]